MISMVLWLIKVGMVTEKKNLPLSLQPFTTQKQPSFSKCNPRFQTEKHLVKLRKSPIPQCHADAPYSHLICHYVLSEGPWMHVVQECWRIMDEKSQELHEFLVFGSPVSGPEKDQTKTAKDQTCGLVFSFLRCKDRKKTGLSEPVLTGLNRFLVAL